MSKIETGGPAFPVSQNNDSDHPVPGFHNRANIPANAFAQYAGMSLRDYFIAHAPAEPQRWFNAVMPPPPRERMLKPEDLTKEEREELAGWGEFIDANDMKQPRARAIAADWERHCKELRAWQAEQEKQRYVQWPAAWADEMLKARGPA